MVVSNNQSSYKQMNESSETDFSPFAGKKYERSRFGDLMFGTDIDYPDLSNPNKDETSLTRAT